MDVYLIRHTAVDTPAGYAYGQTDVGLQPTFRKEAEVVKQKLAHISFDKVWTSPLSRCVKLSDYCGFEDAERDDRIKEMNFGKWEMKSWEEISTDPHSKFWFSDWLNYRTPGGECFMDQYKRVSDFFSMLKEEGAKQVALFTHGGVQACARIYAKECEMADAFKSIPKYGEIVKIEL